VIRTTMLNHRPWLPRKGDRWMRCDLRIEPFEEIV
jgi:hypothetical protein